MQFNDYVVTVSVLLFSIILTIHTENNIGQNKENYCEKNKPCLHGGLCISLEDGTFYCDCKIGFLDPYCRERDPCLLEGKTACRNGATCARKADFDYSCECRIPYVGEHCETINLCEIDPGECIDDISTVNGNCYPCPVNTTCKKLSRSNYNCLCPHDDIGGVSCDKIIKEIFHISNVMYTFEPGEFFMHVAKPSKEYEYEWNFGDVEKTSRVVTEKMLHRPSQQSHITEKAFSVLGSDIMEYDFDHRFKTPGFYPVTVMRLKKTPNGIGNFDDNGVMLYNDTVLVLPNCTVHAHLENLGHESNFSDAPMYEKTKNILLSSNYNITCAGNWKVDIQEVDHTWTVTQVFEKSGVTYSNVTNNVSSIEIKLKALPPGYYVVTLNITMKYKHKVPRKNDSDSNVLTNISTNRPESANYSTTTTSESNLPSINTTEKSGTASSAGTTEESGTASSAGTTEESGTASSAGTTEESGTASSAGTTETTEESKVDLTSSSTTSGPEVTENSTKGRKRPIRVNRIKRLDSDSAVIGTSSTTLMPVLPLPDVNSTTNGISTTTPVPDVNSSSVMSGNGTNTMKPTTPDITADQNFSVNDLGTGIDKGYFVLRDACFIEDVHSPIIPVIVGISLFFYIILLLCMYILTGRKQRPKLIVSADIKAFEVETFYLLTLKTDNRFFAGSSANMVCRLYGEKGRSKLYILQDCKLETAQRGEEDNFLISSVKYLGDLRKISIWHDNTGYLPSWYCFGVIICELKTDTYWHFFVKRWLSVNKNETCVTLDVEAATDEETQNYYYKNKTRRQILNLFKIHHIWIAPFYGSSSANCFSAPERLTVAMTLLCCYFFFASYFTIHGFTKGSLKRYYEVIGCSNQNSRFNFLISESLKAMLCAMIGLICTLLFTILRKIRVPTLLVWKNKAVIQYDITEITKSKLEGNQLNELTNGNVIETSSESSGSTTSEESFEEDGGGERWSNMDPNRVMVVGIPKQPLSEIPEEPFFPLISESGETPVTSHVQCEAFRIPSTDMLETKIWISETLDDSHGPVDVEPIDLVHTMRSTQKSFEGPHRMVELGLIGGITSLKDDIPASFVYKTKSGEGIEYLIENDIRRSYIKPDTQWVDCDPGIISTTVAPRSKITTNNFKSTLTETQNAIIQTDPIIRSRKKKTVEVDESKPFQVRNPEERMEEAVENFVHTQKNKTMTYIELCEMDGYKSWPRLRPVLYYLGWIVCIAIIIITATLTIYFGSKYPKYHSINWCLIVLFGFLFSFFIFQPLKVLIIVLLIFIFNWINEKEPQTPELKQKNERFQLYRVNGLTVLPKMYALKYQVHNQDLSLIGPLLDPKSL